LNIKAAWESNYQQKNRWDPHAIRITSGLLALLTEIDKKPSVASESSLDRAYVKYALNHLKSGYPEIYNDYMSLQKEGKADSIDITRLVMSLANSGDAEAKDALSFAVDFTEKGESTRKPDLMTEYERFLAKHRNDFCEKIELLALRLKEMAI
jgi:hypothetical protein